MATDLEQERRALQVAIQNVVREYEEEGVILNCAITIEAMSAEGERHLLFRTFDINGDALLPWVADGIIRDHLRGIDMQAREGLEGDNE